MREAVAAVRWLLQQAEPEARRVAVQQIAKVRGAEAAELLLRALGDEDWRVRKEAAAIAASLEHRDEIVAGLVAALEETVNIGLRNAAVEALVAIGPEAVGAVVETLGRVDADARKLLIEVLGGVPDARGTVALAAALADEDSNVRVAAAEALGNAALAGEEARDAAKVALVGALATSNTFQKIATLDSLVRLEAKLPWAIVEPLAEDPLLRRYAIAAAAASREPDAVRALARATGDASPTIARDAIVALGDLLAVGLEEDAGLYAVARATLAATANGQNNVRRAALDAEDGRVRAGALLVLGLMGDRGDVPELVEALAEDEVAERADLALRLFGPSAVQPLLEAARSSKSHVRAAALVLAASIEGAEGSVVVAALRAGLRDPALNVLAAALEGLGAIGEADDVRGVAALVGHEDVRISTAASHAVGEIAARHVEAARALLRETRPEQDPAALDCVLLGAIASAQALDGDDIRRLEHTLAHDDPRVRRAAVDALARAGAEAAADAVVFALADEEREVQLAAVRALGRLGRAEPLAWVVANTRDPVLAAAALRALGDADPERALAAARPLVTHADVAVACAAIEAIGLLREADVPAQIARDCEDAVFAAFDHADREVIRLALSVVGARPGPRALARLGLCLDHPSWEVRRLAAELLGQDRSSGAQGLLRARFEREKDPMVREALATAVSVRPTAGPSERGE